MKSRWIGGLGLVTLAVIVASYVVSSISWYRAFLAFPDAAVDFVESFQKDARLPSHCYGTPWQEESYRTFDSKIGACFAQATLEQDSIVLGRDPVDDGLILAYGCDTPEFSANIVFNLARVGGPAWCWYNVAENCDALPPAIRRVQAFDAESDPPTWLASWLVATFYVRGERSSFDLIFDRNNCTGRPRAIEND